MVVNIGFEAGGAEKSVRLIRDALRERGNEVRVVSTDRSLGDRLPFADLIVPQRPKRGIDSILSRIWYRHAYQMLKDAIDDFKPDVIHLHTVGDFGPAAFRATATIPTVVTVHGPEAYTRKLLPWMLPGTAYRGSTYRLRDLRFKGLVYYLYLICVQRPIYRWHFRYVDEFISPSRYMAAAIKHDTKRIPITQVYNGVVFQPAPRFRRTRNVLFVGRLEAVKGVETLLRAAALAVTETDGLTVTIVGDGPDRM